MEIDLNYADWKTINEHKGYSIGFNSELVSIDNLEIELFNKLKKYIKQAKGILIKFYINQNQDLIEISNIMEKINDNTDADMIFGTEIDSHIKIDECRFHVQITGLEKII